MMEILEDRSNISSLSSSVSIFIKHLAAAPMPNVRKSRRNTCLVVALLENMS